MTVLVSLVVNPAAAAGRGASRADDTIAALRELGADVELHRPASAIDARERMAELSASGVERVVVFGGDGMVHLAVNALAGSETALGIVSGGTGNDAAKGLRLPSKIPEACAAALGASTPVDVIETNHGLALTVVTLGFSVAVNERADAMSFPRGRARYTLASLVEIPRLKAHSLTISLDGVVSKIEANLIAIGNTPYFGGGMKVAPDADPRDGLLDVVVIGPAGRPVLAGLLPTVFNGCHVKNKRVRVHRAEHVEISGAELNIRAEGEPLGRLPVTATVRRAGLLVAGIPNADVARS